MNKVDNKDTIKLIAKSSFRGNRLRNIFAIIGIILTTILFTSLFTIASSFLVSMEESTMRQVGTNAHGGFKYLDQEQYDRIKEHPSIKEISYSVFMGVAENKELVKRPTEIRYLSDPNEAKRSYSEPTTGRLPENNSELATDTLVLDRLGIPHELGEKVTIEYSIDGTSHSDTFELVGFWEGDIVNSASFVWLNEDFVTNQLKNHSVKSGDIIGTINADVMFSNSWNIEKKMNKVLGDCGFTSDEISIGVNWAYIGNYSSVGLLSMLSILGIVFLIGFCGYLIISNIFYISVAKDIKFYGMLKTIGTTGKQIKSIINRQALILCALALPIGLLLGYFIGVVICPFIFSMANLYVIKIFVTPLVFLLSAMFSMVTVFISINRPSKIASKVSPVDALRQTDNVSNNSKKTTKRNGKISLLSLAWLNLKRNKKKFIFVTLSISIGLMILNIAYSYSNSFDMDKYLKGSVTFDFQVGDVSNFSHYVRYIDQDTLSTELIEDLKYREGVESYNNIYFSENTVENNINYENILTTYEDIYKEKHYNHGRIVKYRDLPLANHIYGLDDDVFSEMELLEGEIDLEKLKTGKYILIDSFDYEGKVKYYNVGDKVTLHSIDDNTEQEYEIMGIVNYPYPITVKHSHFMGINYYLPSDIFLENIEEKQPMLATLNVDDDYENNFESYFYELCENNENLSYVSKFTYIAEFESLQKSYKMIGIIVSSIIAFIGIVNFINTTISSIISRKKEIAMLRSIGLTNKQSYKILMYEGVIYIGVAFCITLTLGTIIGYASLLNSQMWFLTIKYTIVPSFVCMPFFLVIAIFIPIFSQRYIDKDSIVERLRNENE
ncbi:MAG: ABC transporter permease [Lachnospirales bacterium]